MADSPDADEIAAVFDSFKTGQYCTVALFALVTYEYFITFSTEVRLFWWKRPTGAAVMFLLNWYLTLYIRTFTVLEPHITSETNCMLSVKAYAFLTLFQYVIWAVFSALRVLALSRARLLAAVVGLLAVAPFAVNLAAYYGIMHSTGDIDPMIGCGLVPTRPVTLVQSTIFISLSRGCLILADATVLAVTWWATYRPVSGMKRMAWRKRTLASVVLVNGTGYFIVMLALNIAHLSSTLSAFFNPDAVNASEFSFFSEPITSVLVSRFLLDLQEASVRTIVLDSQDAGAQNTGLSTGPVAETVAFAQMTGSISGYTYAHRSPVEEVALTELPWKSVTTQSSGSENTYIHEPR